MLLEYYSVQEPESKYLVGSYSSLVALLWQLKRVHRAPLRSLYSITYRVTVAQRSRFVSFHERLSSRCYFGSPLPLAWLSHCFGTLGLQLSPARRNRTRRSGVSCHCSDSILACMTTTVLMETVLYPRMLSRNYARRTLAR